MSRLRVKSTDADVTSIDRPSLAGRAAGDLTIDEIVGAAKRAAKAATKRAARAGLPVAATRDGRPVLVRPDGRVEPTSWSTLRDDRKN